jgi:adenylate cyclase
MTAQKVKRKLTAIFSADVKEYSRLMSQDELGTIRTLAAYKEAMSSLIQGYKGRVVDAPGDNVLAEFGSVVDAVNCAVEIQREFAERNAELPYGRRMEFRIGVNLGDVVEEEERIYGDGVNIAARVEGLAEGGGICISGTVYDSIEGKLGLEYEYLGEQPVKNIPKPVRVYRVLSFPGAAAHRVIKAKAVVGRMWRNVALVVAAILVLGVTAVVIWNSFFSFPPVETVSEERPVFDLPEGPSVAVLPFVNLSDDPKQEYFSDGLTENIITGLSGIPKLLVIARNSTFAYKGKPVKVREVASELGVRYLVEGGVQKAGDRARITVQLIDATTGHHLWAEKYDRDLKDIFALQDEITIKIMTALEVKLTEGEQARLRLKGPANLQAFMKGLKALEYYRRSNKQGNTLARQEVEEAIALAPNHSGLHVLLAATHISDLWFGSRFPLISLARASKALKRAIALDSNNSDAYLVLSSLHLMRREHEKAIAAGERAIALNPNGADAYAQLAYALDASDRSGESVEFFEKAIRLNPICPSYYFHELGHAYWALGLYEEAIEAHKKAIHRESANLFAHQGLAVAYISVDRVGEARAEAKEVVRIDPTFSLKGFEKTIPHKNRDRVKRYVEALRKAGLK